MKLKYDETFLNHWRLAEVKDLKPNIEYVRIFLAHYPPIELKRAYHQVHRIERQKGITNQEWKDYKNFLKKYTKEKRIFIRKHI